LAVLERGESRLLVCFRLLALERSR
jgi:hypothetical protein